MKEWKQVRDQKNVERGLESPTPNTFDMVNIRLPKKLVEQIHAEAKAANMSVSAFLTQLLRETGYIRRRSSRKVLNEEMIKRINEVCEKVDTSLDPAIAQMQWQTLKKYSEWKD